MHALYSCDEFEADLGQFDPGLRRTVLAKARRLAQNPKHPSLQAHRIWNTEGKWECYVNRCVRIIYERKGTVIYLWRVGFHGMVDRLRRFTVFSPHTHFRPLSP